jgi:hypothetical protein
MELMTAKRKRTNPFEAAPETRLVRTDKPFVERVLNDIVALGENANPDVMATLNGVSNEKLKDMVKFLNTGKHTNEIKLKLLVGMLPQLADMTKLKEKLDVSIQTIEQLHAAGLWKWVTAQTEGGAFNMDVLRSKLRDIIRSKGGGDVDM